MMTARPTGGAELIRHTRARLDGQPEPHATGLRAACFAAIRDQDWASAALLFERLDRLGGLPVAALAMIRATLAARTGDPVAARAALEQAFKFDPALSGLAETVIRAGISTVRLEAARIILLRAEDDAAARLFLAQAGFGPLVSSRLEGDRVRVLAHWQDHEAIEIDVTDGSGFKARLRLQGNRCESGLFNRTGVLDWPWPDGVVAIRFGLERPGAVLAPETLVRLPLVAAGRPTQAADKHGILVIVPIYDDLEATERCFACLLAGLPAGLPVRIIVVDDAAPDPRLRAFLETLRVRPEITILDNPINLGFTGAVNRALALRRAGEDVLLLNADAFVPPDAIEGLHRAVHADPAFGTATPLSNNGEDTSVPIRFRANALPSDADIARLNGIARRANADAAIPLVNGVGFCLYIRDTVLDAIGGLSGDYARGYFEDVDFCLRAAAAGFINIGAAGVYVGHAGSRSFRETKPALVLRNLERLKARFPAYEAEAERETAANPLANAVNALNTRFFAEMEPDWIAALPLAMPDRVWRALVEAEFGAQGLGLVLRCGESPTGLSVTLQAMNGDYPASLGLVMGKGGHGKGGHAGTEEDLAPALSRHAPSLSRGTIAMMAPAHLPERIRTALQTLASSLRLVNPQGALKDAGAGLAPFARRLLRGDKAFLLAVIGESLKSDCAALIAALADLLAPEGGAIVTLGEPDRLALWPEQPNVWRADPVADEAVPNLLDRLGVQAVLFADRAFGALDPLMAPLLSQGYPVAVFGAALESRAGLCLLDPKDDARAAARRLVGHLGAVLHASEPRDAPHGGDPGVD